MEVSYFSSCGAPYAQNFDSEARTFKFSLRTQEFVTENGFVLLVDRLLHCTRAGTILARRMEEQAGEDIQIRTRCILCGGRELQGEKAVFTSTVSEITCRAHERASEDRAAFLKNVFLKFYRRNVCTLQEKYQRMLSYIKEENVENREFLMNVYTFCRLGTWYDVKFDEVGNVDRRLLF